MGAGLKVCVCVCVCVCVRVYIRVCLYTDSTARRILQAPATLVCTGSFISSPIAGPLFPFCLWIGFKSLIITTVASEESMWKWRAAGVFSPTPLHMSDTMEPSCFSVTHPQTMPPRSFAFWKGRPRCHWLANIFVSSVCVGDGLKLFICEEPWSYFWVIFELLSYFWPEFLTRIYHLTHI